MTNPTLYLKKLVKGQNKQLQRETQREVYQESDSQRGELREERETRREILAGKFSRRDENHQPIKSESPSRINKRNTLRGISR